MYVCNVVSPAPMLLCRNPVDRILSAYEFIVEVASRQVLKVNPGKKVSHLARQHMHAGRASLQCLCIRGTNT